MENIKRKFTIELQHVSLDDIGQVGGKNASLGEMIKNLSELGVTIPHGFAITSEAYWAFLKFNNLEKPMLEIISEIDIDDLISLRKAGSKTRQLIRNGKFPLELEKEIIQSYTLLSNKYDQEATDVAVRSSATAEDLPNDSFAGQQETYLNVRGKEGILESVRNCFASLFTDRAISYREHLEFDHFDTALSVCVQKMVRSDLACSGVAFSLDMESGFKDAVIINASYGLGDLIMQGAVSPDEYIVFKPALQKGFASIIEKTLGKKDCKMIYGDDPGELTKVVNVQKDQQQRFCLTDEQVLELSRAVCKIEDYYSEKKNRWCPMDVEWAIDGLTNKLFIVQARPETIHSRKDKDVLVEYNLMEPAPDKRLLKGIAVGSKIGTGKVVVMFSLDGRDGSHDGVDFCQGDILVTEMTDPNWEPIMKKASAIVTNKGGRTCHAAIIARELGVPAIVGTMNCTDVLKDGQVVTVSCCEGDAGYVYQGTIAFQRLETNLRELPKVSTPIMLNVGSPELAFRFSNIPNAGVGLAREEFIITTCIKAHPLALLHHREQGDSVLTEKIGQLITGYPSEESFFVQKLSYGIGKIGAAFYPNPVIVRFSDFKTNEYANLLGGSYFEPKEENPMMGWRGASRYYSEKYRHAFGLECEAIKCVRQKMGLNNVVVMIPFCRTVNELKRVYEVMKMYGLERGKDGLKVYLMAEIPSNIILAEEFADHIDGFSIGSNDLTQFTLGVDRDSSLVTEHSDERNPAVKSLISSLIKTGKRKGVKVGICGQGPSDFPDFAAFLVDEGIDSISVTPDSVLKTMKTLALLSSRELVEN